MIAIKMSSAYDIYEDNLRVYNFVILCSGLGLIGISEDEGEFSHEQAF